MAEIKLTSILKRLRKAGAICCEGCGGVIYEKEPECTLGYVKTKRGTEIIIHKKCLDKVWRSKIRGGGK